MKKLIATGGAVGVVVVGLVAMLALPFAAAFGVWTAVHAGPLKSPTPTEEAVEDIPDGLLNGYLNAGITCDVVPWNAIAAVGKVEHDHGRESRLLFTGPLPPWVEPNADEQFADGLGPDIDTLDENHQRVQQLAEFLCEGTQERRDELLDGGETPELPPIGSPDGTTFDVASVGEFNTAATAAGPGDVIRITSTIRSRLVYRGADGTETEPITITAAGSDLWIDPGNTSNNVAGLEVRSADHVNVIGVNVRNSQFGIWMRDVNGTVTAPVVVANSIVQDIGHSGIVIAGDPATGLGSHHVRIERNRVTRTGLTAPQYGEGIYIGRGSPEWSDATSEVVVAMNDVSFTGAEGVDVKPGTRNIAVEGNLIHDLAPISGGAISAHYVGNNPNPDVATIAPVIIRGNAIWNLNRDATPGANDWAIWVGHGGVTIDSNAIWGLRDVPSARAVRVRALSDFGSHPIQITNNIFWTRVGWVAEGIPSGAHLIEASGNQGPEGAPGVEGTLQGEGFPGVGEGGTADNGGGPGSVFGFTPSTLGPGGYESAEAAQALRQALRKYRDDDSWIDEVLEVAADYAALPTAGGGIDGQPPDLDERGCPTGPAPESDTVRVRGYQVHTCIAASFAALYDAAEADGVRLNGGSGWRDHFRQHALRAINTCPSTGRRGTAADNSHVHVANEPASPWVPASQCRVPTARPGQSNHEGGVAIDFRYEGRGIPTRNNAGYRWLRDNAATYGFYNLPSEPWHWSVNGR